MLYHIASVASLSASPFIPFMPFLPHCFLCFTLCLTIGTDTSYLFYHTTSLLNWVPHHLYCSYPFYHTAFSLPRHLYWYFIPVLSHRLCCLFECLTICTFHTCSITLLLCLIDCLTICTVHTHPIALLSLLYYVPRSLYWYFIPVLSHCLCCLVECLTICTLHTCSMTILNCFIECLTICTVHNHPITLLSLLYYVPRHL